MSVSLVYVTTSNSDEAAYIGKIPVTERFAASVNVLGEVQSIFRWEENIYDKMETLLIAKTDTLRVDEAIKRIRSVHSYQCPCIVTWRLDAGNSSYLDWIGRETEQ